MLLLHLAVNHIKHELQYAVILLQILLFEMDFYVYVLSTVLVLQCHIINIKLKYSHFSVLL